MNSRSVKENDRPDWFQWMAFCVIALILWVPWRKVLTRVLSMLSLVAIGVLLALFWSDTFASQPDFGPQEPPPPPVSRVARSAHSYSYGVSGSRCHLHGLTVWRGGKVVVDHTADLKVQVQPWTFRVNKGAEFRVRKGAALYVRDFSGCPE